MDQRQLADYVFLPSGDLLGFWEGGFPRRGERSRLYVELEKPAEQIFPLEYCVDPGLATGTLEGTVRGFYWLDSGGTTRIELTTRWRTVT